MNETLFEKKLPRTDLIIIMMFQQSSRKLFIHNHATGALNSIKIATDEASLPHKAELLKKGET